MPRIFTASLLFLTFTTQIFAISAVRENYDSRRQAFDRQASIDDFTYNILSLLSRNPSAIPARTNEVKDILRAVMATEIMYAVSSSAYDDALMGCRTGLEGDKNRIDHYQILKDTQELSRALADYYVYNADWRNFEQNERFFLEPRIDESIAYFIEKKSLSRISVDREKFLGLFFEALDEHSAGLIARGDAPLISQMKSIQQKIQKAKTDGRPVVLVLGAIPEERFHFNFEDIIQSKGKAPFTIYIDQGDDSKKDYNYQNDDSFLIRANFMNGDFLRMFVHYCQNSFDLITVDQGVACTNTFNRTHIDYFSRLLEFGGEMMFDHTRISLRLGGPFPYEDQSAHPNLPPFSTEENNIELIVHNIKELCELKRFYFIVTKKTESSFSDREYMKILQKEEVPENIKKQFSIYLRKWALFNNLNNIDMTLERNVLPYWNMSHNRYNYNSHVAQNMYIKIIKIRE